MPHPSLYNIRRDPQPVKVSSIPVEDNKCAICLFPFGKTDPDDNEITAAQECLSIFDEEPPFPYNPSSPFSNNPVKLRCNHIFGKFCIDAAVEISNRCPLCRSQLYDNNAAEERSPEDRHRITKGRRFECETSYRKIHHTLFSQALMCIFPLQLLRRLRRLIAEFRQRRHYHATSGSTRSSTTWQRIG